MIQRVEIEGINLPRLYIAETSQDVDTCKANGVPFIRWKHGSEELVRQLLRPALEKMFPHIKWNDVLGRKRKFRTDVEYVDGHIETEPVDEEIAVDYDMDSQYEAIMEYDDNLSEISFGDGDEEISEAADIAMSKREFSNDNSMEGYDVSWGTVAVGDYIGDISSEVNIDVLQKLGMLPKFLGDIADCIRVNMSNSMRWTEGYNKKLGVPVGKFNGKAQLPNLIILDVSASIPRGIAATMLQLIDTMRGMCDAELIVTASRSAYYPSDRELPSAQALRDYHTPGQEAREFLAIIDKYVQGREWGHVICFGDNDAPSYFSRSGEYKLTNTKVHQLHSYHTFSYSVLAGYCEWVPMCSPDVEIFKDCNWCKIMK